MLQSCPWIGLTRGLGSVRRCRGFSVFGESGWVGAVSGWVGLNRVTENGPVDNSAMLDQLRRVSTSIHPQISSRTATPRHPGALLYTAASLHARRWNRHKAG